jgi:hypothetical protein
MGAPWKSSDRVPNAPLREAFLSSPMTASEVCFAVGWRRDKTGRNDTHADTTLLMRTLGLSTTLNRARKSGEIYRSTYQTVTIVNAQAICAALGVDFDELYEGLLPAQEPAGVCGCGNPMLRPAPRCQFCVEEAELSGVAA